LGDEAVSVVLSEKDVERDAERDVELLAELSVEMASRGCYGYDDPEALDSILTKAVAGKGATILCEDGVYRVVARGGKLVFLRVRG